MKKKYIFALCLPLLFLGLTTGCGDDTAPEEPVAPGVVEPEEVEEPAPTMAEPSPLHESLSPGAIQATITMEGGGTITLELYHDIAPQTVQNFVYLVRQGFYDGLTFHRIIPGFMIQGGGPNEDGRGTSPHNIRGEFTENGFENNLLHERGVLSMARPADFDGAGAQFFIMHSDYPSLDRLYASFGRVIDGMDVVDHIATTTPTDNNSIAAPEDRPVIRSITIDSDVDLPPPDKI